MNKKIFPTVTAIILLVIFGISISVNAFSIKELFGFGEDDEAKTAQSDKNQSSAQDKQTENGPANWARQDAKGEAKLSLKEIESVMVNLNANQRAAILTNAEQFKQFVKQESGNVSVLNAAVANDLHKDQNTLFLMRRGAETILRESYLNRLLNSKIAADFPSDEQVKEYYEKNKAQFLTADRVHLWQVFFPVTEKNADTFAAVEKKANAVAKQLISGKLDFTQAVDTYSEHEQSRVNAGYMGLLKVEELKPELSDVIINLKPGAISQAARSDTGVHIFKRGDRIAQKTVALEQVDAQIRSTLRQQAQAQLLKAVYEEAEKTYPQEVTEAEIEQWRQRLESGS